MKQIIILDAMRLRLTTDQSEQVRLRALFWFPVAAGKEVPLIDAHTTRYSQASPEEQAALRAGSIIEEDHEQFFSVDQTPLQIRQALVASYDARQTILNQPARINLGQFTGASYEDGTWRRA